MEANSYDVTSCGKSSGNVFSIDSNASNKFRINNCRSDARRFEIDSGLSGSHAQWQWAGVTSARTPDGTNLQSVILTGMDLHRGGNNWGAGLMYLDGSGNYVSGDYDDGCMPGTTNTCDIQSGNAASYGGRGARSVFFGVMCYAASCASGNGSSPHASVRAAEMTLRIDDFTAPGVRINGGGLLSGWKSGGVHNVDWSAGDSTGLRNTGFRIDGGGGRDDARGCDFRNVVPCSNHGGPYGIDVSGLSDGGHTVQVFVDDAAGNRNSASAGFSVDNNVPGQVSPSVDGGSAWRSTNGFRVSWSNPSQGDGSPLSGAVYRLCSSAGSCTEGTANSNTEISNLQLPGNGEYTLRVALRDAAGQGDWSDAQTLRLDTSLPANAEPTKNNGWVSAAEARAYDQEIRLPDEAALPPSGLAGYSVGLDDDVVDGTVEAAADELGKGRYRIPTDRLTEGTHVFKARAISHAGTLAAELGTTELRVDLTAPSASAEDVPAAGSWSPGDIAVRLKGSDALSGMQGADPGVPVEEGAYIAYTVDDGPKQRGRGGEVPVTLTGNGVHSVTYQAFDVAGNPSTERTFTVKIDSTPPGRARAAEPSGWLSEKEAATYDQAFELALGETRPPSGIRGYSYTTNGSDPDESVEVADDPATVALRSLPEGANTVNARAVSGAGVASPLVGTAQVKVDRTVPAASAEGVPEAEWSRGVVTLRLLGADQAALSGMDEGEMSYRIDGGPVERGRGGQVEVPISGNGRHTITYQAIDAAGNESTERSATFKTDATAPETVAFEAQDAADPRKVVVIASDRTSGIASGVVEVSRAGSGTWQALETRRSGERFVARLNDEQMDRSATYGLRARVTDVAGNEAMGDRRIDGSPALVAGNMRVGTRLSAGGLQQAKSQKVCKAKKKARKGLKRKAKRTCKVKKSPEQVTTTLRVPFGKVAIVRGRLTDEAGRPIGGAVIDVQAKHRASGAEWKPEGTVRADGAGGFEYRAPAGASRTLRLAYAGSNVDHGSFADTEVLVPGGLSLKASRKRVRNGQSVKFSGRVLGGPLPPAGVKVDLQVHYRGKWRTFATARARGAGAFSHRYRFQSTRGTVKYKFRARLKREAAYPYELGDSKLTTVTVSGR